MPCFLTARLSAFSSFSLQYPRTDVVVPPGVVVFPPGVLVVVDAVVDFPVGLRAGGSAAGRFLVVVDADADAVGFLPPPPVLTVGFFLGGIS